MTALADEEVAPPDATPGDQLPKDRPTDQSITVDDSSQQTAPATPCEVNGDVHSAALSWADARCSVIPVRADGTKSPLGAWKEFQRRRRTIAELSRTFPPGTRLGIGIVCGTVSGGLEMLEFEGRAVAEGITDEFATAMRDHGLGAVWDRLTGGLVQHSPSGGVHLVYRVTGGPVLGNTKLASRPATAEELEADPKNKTPVLIETRGEGGQFVGAPSGGTVHPSGGSWMLAVGNPSTIPTITADQRDLMFALATMFDRTPIKPAPVTRSIGARPADGARPGDVFNARADWSDILEPHGWVRVASMGTGYTWRRPGKSGGSSATTGQSTDGVDRFYVFSTSTEFEAQKPYSKFGAFALLEHGGDYSSAARDLVAKGYGDRQQPPPTRYDVEISARNAATSGIRKATTVSSAAQQPDSGGMATRAEQVTLHDVHNRFRRWLGDDYDTEALDVVLAATVVERLDGDPLWLLLLSGSGNAKTETVQSISTCANVIITSTISSLGALLSATAAKERAKDATGGLLRRLEPRGVMVIKDVTSILSMNRDMRAEVLGALREVYDGRWSRNVGTDGGRTLEWAGRIAVIGAVTTAWDRAHDVIASMGDRFVVVRMDSTEGRQAAGRQAIANTGREEQMRLELAEAVSALVDTALLEAVTLTDEETDRLLAAADVVTLARTGVEYDYRGDVIDAHAPEMPTRFAKQLAQVVRGAVAIGVPRDRALRLAIRCARDSMPPLRLAILDDLAQHPDSATKDVRKRTGKPRNTVDRQLQALHMLGVIDCTEKETEWAGKPATIWQYRLADGIDADVLDPKSVPDLLVIPPIPSDEGPAAAPVPCLGTDRLHTPTNKSGTDPADLLGGPAPCQVCGHALLLNDGRSICAKTDDAHRAARDATNGDPGPTT